MKIKQFIHTFNQDFTDLLRYSWDWHIHPRLICGRLDVLPPSCFWDCHCFRDPQSIINLVGLSICWGKMVVESIPWSLYVLLILSDAYSKWIYRLPPAYMIERGKASSNFCSKYMGADGKMVYELKSMEQYSRVRYFRIEFTIATFAQLLILRVVVQIGAKLCRSAI